MQPSDLGIAAGIGLIGRYVRYRRELLTAEKLVLYGTIVLEGYFKVNRIDIKDGDVVLNARLPGDPFSREILLSEVEPVDSSLVKEGRS